MQPISYFQFLKELTSHYHNKEIVIEISKFNKFAGAIKSHNIICNFDYNDLEDYARTLPNSTHVEYSRITFNPSNSWVKTVEHFAQYYNPPKDLIKIVKVWESTKR